MVHTFGVVEEKPVHELLVEAVHVEEQHVVVIHEIFLDRPVEPLDVCVHLGSLRVRVVVRDLQLEETLGEVLLPLASVVRENEGGWIGKDFDPLLEELFSCFGCMRAGTPGKRKPGIDIFTGDDMSAQAVHEPLHRIEGNDMAGMVSG